MEKNCKNCKFCKKSSRRVEKIELSNCQIDNGMVSLNASCKAHTDDTSSNDDTLSDDTSNDGNKR